MRTAFRLGTLALSLALAASCNDSTITGTQQTEQLTARIAVSARLTPSATQAFNSLEGFGLKVTTVRVRLIAADSSARDTLLAFPGGMDAVQVDLAVPARTAGQAFRADVELYDANGFVLFSGSQQVTARDPGSTGSPPAMIDVSYTGPAANAKTLAIVPSPASITGNASLPLSATATDAADAKLACLVRWTSSDPSLATVTASGHATAIVTSTGKRGAVTITASTPLGISSTATVRLVPVATKVVVISGSGQTAPAGTTLPQPLVIEAQAADNLPVPDAPIAFRAVTAGATVSSMAAVTDAEGRASATITLGTTVGAYVIEASSGSLPPVTATMTAAPAPASAIAIVGGNFQDGVLRTALVEPLVVKVMDRFGVPVSGIAVQWATISGGGAPSATTSTSGNDGKASMTYTLGTTVQTESVRASLPGVAGPSGEVFFSVGAVSTGPDAVLVEGSGQHATVGAELADPLAVTVIDRYGNPVARAAVNWSATSGSGASATFSPAVSTTDVNGRASTRATLGSTPGVLSIIATAGTATGKFIATADPNVSPGASGTISGLVYDAVSGAPLANVSVDISPSIVALSSCEGSGCFTVRTFAAPISRATNQSSILTGANGRFTSALLNAGCYDITYTYVGFVMTVVSNVCVDGNIVVEAAPLVPSSGTPGSIAGTVMNATTNQAVTGAVTVELRAGMNNTTGALVQSTSTNGSGQYVFSNVSPGTYTVRAHATGYTDAYKTGIAVGATTTSNQNIYLSPVGAAGSVRIVLTWRTTPRDLDSHLTGPTSGGSRFHVWYAGSGSCTSSPFACLDVDVTSGSGPETVTISQMFAGVYRYSVQNYSAAGNGSNPSDLTLSNSGGRVDVYINNALVQTFSVPAGAGSLWTVFELNGTTITPINLVSAGPVLLPSRIPTARGASSAAARTDATVIFDGIRANPKSRLIPR